MLDFQNHQTIAGFFVWNLPFLRGNDSALGKIARRLDAHRERLLELQPTRAPASAPGTTRTRTTGATTTPRSSGTSLPEDGDHRPGRPALPVVRPGRPSCTRTARCNRTFSPETTTHGVNVITQLPWAWRVDAGLMKDFRIVARHQAAVPARGLQPVQPREPQRPEPQREQHGLRHDPRQVRRGSPDPAGAPLHVLEPSSAFRAGATWPRPGRFPYTRRRREG